MLLKSLELNGFKTFPDKTKLLFEKGITAVVGPNGSGKSNISDAIRWVLGEQSTKTLRCAKMEDVIFGGTETRKSQGFSEVTLTIDNCDRRLNFDNDDVAVTRRYYRSGESEYLINSTAVRLKDVHELFMDTGLGRDGYSLVSQGKIDSIVASKSEDRREIFEEAAGISKYRYRKIESQRKLKQTEENLVRLNDILSELKSRIVPLKEQADKAKSYILYTNEKRDLEISLWLNAIEKSSKALREQEAKIAVSQNHYNEINELLENLKNEIETVFFKSNSCTAQMDKIRDEIFSYEEDATNKKANVKILQNDILHNDENTQRLKKELKEITASFDDMNKEIKKKQCCIESIKNEINEANLNLNKILTELDNLKDELEKFSNASSDFTKELSNLSQKSTDSKVILANAKSYIQEANNRISTIDVSIDTYEKDFLNNEKEIHEYEIMQKNINDELVSLKNTLNGYEIKFKSKKQKCDELKAKCDKLHFESEGKIRRIKFLEDMEKNLEGFNHSVKTVMNALKNGVIRGVHGTISQIVKVPAKYSVAIEIALGAAMQNIVVSTEEDAKRAIEMLKNKNSGRATFLPICTIKGKKLLAEGVEALPGFIGIADNLCSSEGKYKEVLKSLLGRIVIADNINNAIKIAKNFSYKFKIVTLDGQVINAGGSLTGGSLLKNIGFLSRKAEIETLKLNEKSLKKKKQEAYSIFEKMKEEISKLEANICGINGDLLCKKEENIKVESECNRLYYDHKNLNFKINELKEEKKCLLLKLNEMKELYENEEEKHKSINNKITEIEKNISMTSGNKEDILQKRENIVLKIQEIRLKIDSKEKAIDTIGLEIKTIEENKLNQNNKEKELKVQIENLHKNNKLILNQIEKSKEETESLCKKIKGANNQIDRISNERIELEKRALKLRSEEREVTSKREMITQDLTRIEERKMNIQKEYDSVIGKLWDEYELTKKEAEQKCEKIENIQEANRRLNSLKLKIKALGCVNVGAVDEYKEVFDRYEFMKSQIDDVEKSKKEVLKLIDDLTHRMKKMFTERFEEINNNFSSTFKELFGGGNAKLSITNKNDVLNSGIEIEVNPPGKIVTHLESLSGGEKALVAISLYFAIMKVSPAPFCVLDEIEAALDEVNVERYAKYLRKMNNNTQFIVVTHRRGTMEEADVLYGVTMQDEGISKLLKLQAFEVYNKMNVN